MSNELINQNEIDALVQESLSSSQDEHLTEEERDTLAEIGNISMGSAATALSSLINKKVTITVPNVTVSTLAEIQKSYPIPCIIVNVEYVTGLQGSNLLVIKEKDASIIGNLMIGTDVNEIPDEVDELSLSALSEAMNVMMGSAATAMSELFRYKISISPPDAFRQNLGDKIENVDCDCLYAVVAFRFNIVDLIDSVMLQIIDLEFAKNMVSKLLAIEAEKLSAAEPALPEQPPVNAEAGQDSTAAIPWLELQQESAPTLDLGNLNIELIKDIPVNIRAVLGRTRMSIENILKLGPGHIMELDTLDGEPIDVYANDTLIGRGEVVVVGEQFGIRITEISTPNNRIKSIG
ncbi:MAG: flagellar motor switch phosphatase FliY [Firmicutes bacterium]|jgi:flagellar motor switch protein FliN/FliY|nr:flagellar motor switch phosphatase FliY [Bacillota bacterium]NLL87417.1 flagellar motor switch phosphatase FliY [Bacillota bacterium]HKM18341.1 flagellar motor switch phosphatase FliY [Limnochordia bacterium]